MEKFKWVLGIIVVLALLVGSSAPFLVSMTPVSAQTENPYLFRNFVDEDGNQIDEIIVPGRPPEIKAEAVEVPQPNIAMGINTLIQVPAFDWSYGCSATSAAMLFGYYDRTGYSNMYTGPTNGGVCPLDNSIWGPGIGGSDGECPLSATHQGKDGRTMRGHVDDFWYALDSQLDPYYDSVPPWTQHTYADCTADFMGTNQYQNWNNIDSSTRFWYNTNGAPLYDYTDCEYETTPTRDGCHGMRLFAESRGYSVVTNFGQYIYGYNGNTLGFTFDQFTDEIDAGRPVLIQIEGHTMLGYGYNTTGNLVYIHDTWDHSNHQMIWGGSYSDAQHYGVTVIQLAPTVPLSVTTNNATNITTNSATLNGTLNNLGTAPTVYVSFEHGLTTAYGQETTPQLMTTTGAFNFPLTSLLPNTTYHFRAKAVGDGTSYGLDKSFPTSQIGACVVSIVPETQMVAAGGSFSVDVEVDSQAFLVKGCEVTVTFDADLTATAAIGADLLGTAAETLRLGPMIPNGEVSYSVVRMPGNDPAAVAGDFMTIDFNVDPAAAGTYSLTIEATLLGADGLTIPGVVENNGQVNIVTNGRKGDFDGDGDIDIFDFVDFADAYGSETGDPNYNAIGDFNDDGDIDIFDFVDFADVYGT